MESQSVIRLRVSLLPSHGELVPVNREAGGGFTFFSKPYFPSVLLASTDNGGNHSNSNIRGLSGNFLSLRGNLSPCKNPSLPSGYQKNCRCCQKYGRNNP